MSNRGKYEIIFCTPNDSEYTNITYEFTENQKEDFIKKIFELGKYHNTLTIKINKEV